MGMSSQSQLVVQPEGDTFAPFKTLVHQVEGHSFPTDAKVCQPNSTGREEGRERVGWVREECNRQQCQAEGRSGLEDLMYSSLLPDPDLPAQINVDFCVILLCKSKLISCRY